MHIHTRMGCYKGKLVVIKETAFGAHVHSRRLISNLPTTLKWQLVAPLASQVFVLAY